MPIPFDRFRLLNETKKRVRVRNRSAFDAEAQFDSGEFVPVPPNGETPEVEAREVLCGRVNETDPPVELEVVVVDIPEG